MPNFTINCKGKLLDFSTPKVMGILNITPDSFFDGGKYVSHNEVLTQAEKMLADGAAIIDLGGQSSRPGANRVGEEEELKRLIPAIEAILKQFPETVISVDTYNAKVAEEAINSGAAIINDISGGEMDKRMFETVARLKVPYILTHIKGTPETMQNNPQYGNVVLDVLEYFTRKVNELKQLGVADIILDPGFGFGKKLEHNYALLQDFANFGMLGYPLLAGISRKSMVYRLLNIDASQALNGTTALNMLLLQRGANILRVHDVKEAMECVKIAGMMKMLK